MKKVESLKVKIYADGAELKSMIALSQEPIVKGLTTNPSLMRKEGITDYETFARSVLQAISNKPISFERFLLMMLMPWKRKHESLLHGGKMYT
jgi:transaldolase